MRNAAPDSRAIKAMKKTQRNRKIFQWLVIDRRTIPEIKEEFGIGRARAYVIAREVEKELAAEFEQDKLSTKARLTASLENMMRQLWTDYLDSGGQVDVVTVTESGEGSSTSTTTKEQRRDAALAAQARGCANDIRNMWGLDAPRKQAITNADGDGPAEVVHRVESMPPEQLQAIAEARTVIETTATIVSDEDAAIPNAKPVKPRATHVIGELPIPE
tara:strand:- start:220 stop:870 length:651 start_codon:yes stop_codon:yes gene_type:complete